MRVLKNFQTIFVINSSTEYSAGGRTSLMYMGVAYAPLRYFSYM